MKCITLIIWSLLGIGFVQAQQLETLIEVALGNSPEIQKFELQYNRVSEKVNEVNSLPNTEIGLAYFLSEPETRTGAQQIRISLRQMLPWFGSITARENYASSLADAKYEDVVLAKRKLIASVSQAFYNLYTIRSKQQVLAENISLLKTYETLALNAVEVAKASAVDVLRLQMRQNEMEQMFSVLEQQFLSEQALINNLLNRDPSFEIEILTSLLIPEQEEIIKLEALHLHPELIRFDKLYNSIEKSELLNQKESSPMLGLGFDYVPVANRPDMNFSDNGKDIVMPMISFSIPIFSKKYRSQTKQNALEQKEILAEKQQRYNYLETLLEKATNERIAAKIIYDTQLKNLKQAKDAEQILIKSYETGTIDFRDVLDIQELQLKFQMNQIEAIRNFYIQSSIINYLTN